ncbi:hypothetical protein [Nocardioides sp.]|uniref:hypothetical protein n=1 Tax=Nocardioides sp. TaxID=35761 RepID=UPI002D050840|nr:hypothetical protein [Nocardioides sp.]HXH79150.1 hypothetical protein [Nocardioides sp.]
MARADRWAPTLWSLVLAVLMLGGALGPGYVLSYDMVWVPDLVLTRDAWGVGTALPRAVPSDAVVAVLDTVIPGMLLQKLVLLGSLVGAGTGAAALIGRRSLGAQLVAASLIMWNPFVVERLVIGHWPVLVGYAVLPWLLLVVRRWDVGARWPAALPVLLVLGSLSASTGVATGIAALAGGWRRRAGRRNALLAASVLAANLPWLVAGLLHAADATSAAAGAEVFAASGEGLLPGPLAALSLGGIWNVEVVPATRLGFLAVASLVAVGALAVAGGLTHRRTPIAGLAALVVCWAAGWGLAVVSWAAPDAIGWLAAHVPGGGLLRDGSRLLALAAPLTVVLAARGADAALERLPDPPTRVLVAGLLALLPVALMPDAAWGSSGELRAVSYPSVLHDMRAAVHEAPAGDVVLLPFTSYRAPEWNNGHKVLDPLPRFVGRQAIANDVLSVDGRPIPGEDPRAADVADALALGTPEERGRALAALGVAVVVSEQLGTQEIVEVTGETTFDEDGLRVVEVEGEVRAEEVPRQWTAAMGVAWVAWLGLFVGGSASGVRRKVTRE